LNNGYQESFQGIMKNLAMQEIKTGPKIRSSITQYQGDTMFKTFSKMSLALGVGMLACSAWAQMPNAYGTNISVDAARKVAISAVAEAQKNGWTMAVAVTDTGGNLVYYEKMDNTQIGSANVAVGKARSAVLYKRPTKAMQDALAAGGEGWRILALEGAVPVEGGLPLLVEGKIIGAIGLSGGTSAQDGMAAKAGVDALK
jgi:uncharacterized protein GlcG (DUF336 family)